MKSRLSSGRSSWVGRLLSQRGVPEGGQQTNGRAGGTGRRLDWTGRWNTEAN